MSDNNDNDNIIMILILVLIMITIMIILIIIMKQFDNRIPQTIIQSPWTMSKVIVW